MTPMSEFDPPEASLRRLVGRGAAVTGLSQAAQMVIQFTSVLLLARLLSPEDFGLIAMCAPIISLLMMLQDFGLVQATVQKKGLTRSEVNVLFWINLAVSAGLALLLALASPLIASFYQEPRIGPLIAATSVTVLLAGSGAQHVALLNRRMAFGQLAIVSVVNSGMALVGAVAWSLVSPSYWALFFGTLLGLVLSTALAWIFSRWRPTMPRRVEGAGNLLKFGAGITGFNLANFVARNGDNVLIGRAWGELQLGFYDRAYKLLLFPLQQIANPLSKVMVPALSRLEGEPDRYRHAFLRVQNLSLLASLPGVAFMTAMADVLIPFMLGPKWEPSAMIFAALGFAGLVQTLSNPTGWLFISQGRSGDYATWGLVSAVIAVGSFLLGLPYGAFGVAVAYAVSETLKSPILWVVACRKGPIRLGDVVRSCGPMMLAAYGSLAAAWWIKSDLGDGPLQTLTLALALCYIVFILLILPFSSGRSTLREAGALLRQLATRFRRAQA
ncbi:lipopolysaccharide biosynthesis protein [Rubellimicrobium rubrum]|uniref:Lipopolysaccharide biosynthesis protein n=1 Tax=Rubellimicrobium rubrum TaxID=2585369 RepID=A0A5C4MWR3_9RHOB|nr:lipopolysaccharide biosynthesis protein [Rubellimicrobium rubrum]TNC49153.1 lipopolysaccharide biosynthesis protein [Rubellimicrobium rubrum]